MRAGNICYGLFVAIIGFWTSSVIDILVYDLYWRMRTFIARRKGKPIPKFSGAHWKDSTFLAPFVCSMIFSIGTCTGSMANMQ